MCNFLDNTVFITRWQRGRVVSTEVRVRKFNLGRELAPETPAAVLGMDGNPKGRVGQCSTE